MVGDPVADSAANADCAGRASYSRGGEIEAHHPEQGVQEPFGPGAAGDGRGAAGSGAVSMARSE